MDGTVGLSARSVPFQNSGLNLTQIINTSLKLEGPQKPTRDKDAEVKGFSLNPKTSC